MPTGYPGVGCMENPVNIIPTAFQGIHQRDTRHAEIPGKGGRTHLVVNHAQRLSLRCDAQHRLQKIMPDMGVKPGGSQDNVLIGLFGNALFSSQFGPAVDAFGCHRHLFGVRRRSGTVKNIISGIMYQRNSESLAGLCHLPRGVRVNELSKLRLGFRFIHRGISRRIDDQLRLNLTNKIRQGLGLGKIHVRLVEKGYDMMGRQQLGKRRTQLSHPAKNKDTHLLGSDRQGGELRQPRCHGILSRQDRIVDRPLDADIRIVPEYSCIIFRHIK